MSFPLSIFPFTQVSINNNLAKSHRNQVNLDAWAMGGQPQVRSSGSPYLLPQKAFVERTEMVLLKKDLETHFSRQLTL